jgi:hypothetical protein
LPHPRVKEPERSARLGEIADDLQHATEPHRVEDLDRPRVIADVAARADVVEA